MNLILVYVSACYVWKRTFCNSDILYVSLKNPFEMTLLALYLELEESNASIIWERANEWEQNT